MIKLDTLINRPPLKETEDAFARLMLLLIMIPFVVPLGWLVDIAWRLAVSFFLLPSSLSSQLLQLSPSALVDTVLILFCLVSILAEIKILRYQQRDEPQLQPVAASLEETIQLFNSIEGRTFAGCIWKLLSYENDGQSGVIRRSYLARVGKTKRGYNVRLHSCFVRTAQDRVFFAYHWFEYEGSPLCRLRLAKLLQDTDRLVSSMFPRFNGLQVGDE